MTSQTQIDFEMEIARSVSKIATSLADSPLSRIEALKELKGYYRGYCDAKGFGLSMMLHSICGTLSHKKSKISLAIHTSFGRVILTVEALNGNEKLPKSEKRMGVLTV